MIRSLKALSRQKATSSHHWMAGMVLKTQRHLVAPPPVHHPSPQWGGKCLTALVLGIVWKFKWSQPKMGEQLPHPHKPGRHQWWKTCSETVRLTSPKQLWWALVWPPWFMEGNLLGEGLSLGEVCDAMFMLAGAISWVGKQAQLNANALTLWEGWQLIAQAITDWCVEARGSGCPCTHLPALPPLSFCGQDGPSPEVRLPSTDECVEEPRHTHQTSHHDWGWIPQWGQNHGQIQWDLWAAPPHHLHWIVGSRVGLEDQDTHTMAYTAGNLEAIWKSTCQSARTRTWKMLSLIKVGTGTWWFITVLGAQIAPFSPMLSTPYKAT